MGRATIVKWDEGEYESSKDISEGYCWRQELDITTEKLSASSPRCILNLSSSCFLTTGPLTQSKPPCQQDPQCHCTCQEPQNPDYPLLQCINQACQSQMHDAYILKDKLIRLNEQAHKSNSAVAEAISNRTEHRPKRRRQKTKFNLRPPGLGDYSRAKMFSISILHRSATVGGSRKNQCSRSQG